jgi:hypothetical protein
VQLRLSALVSRMRFDRHLLKLEAELRKSGPERQDRTDLPTEVIALAARLIERPSRSSFQTISVSPARR